MGKDLHFDRNLVVNGIPLTILAYSAYPAYSANESSLRIVPPPWSESDLKVGKKKQHSLPKCAPLEQHGHPRGKQIEV